MNKMKWTVLISFYSMMLGIGIGITVGYHQGEAVLTAFGPAAWIGHGLADRNEAIVKHIIFRDGLWGGLWGAVIGGIFTICFHRGRSWRSPSRRAV